MRELHSLRLRAQWTVIGDLKLFDLPTNSDQLHQVVLSQEEISWSEESNSEMKAIHLTAYGNPAQNLRMAEVSEPKAPSDGEALMRMEYAPINDGVVYYERANLLAERIILRFVSTLSDQPIT